MGSGTSSSGCGVIQSSLDAAKMLAIKRREPQSPRRVYFCHSCSSFSYDSFAENPRIDVECPPLLCPHPFCRPSSESQLEEIPSTSEGSLRLQVIMLELINSRAAARPRIPRPTSIGVRTVDVILSIEIVNLNVEGTGDQLVCSVCNDNFSNGTCCRKEIPNCCKKEIPEEEKVTQDAGMKLQCGHIFHQSCILPWLASHQTCPCCRATVNECNEVPSPEELVEVFDEVQLARKLEYGLNTKSYLMAKEIEASMTFDRKEDKKLSKVEYTIDKPSSVLLSASERKIELSNRLHGLLMVVHSGPSSQ